MNFDDVCARIKILENNVALLTRRLDVSDEYLRWVGSAVENVNEHTDRLNEKIRFLLEKHQELNGSLSNDAVNRLNVFQKDLVGVLEFAEENKFMIRRLAESQAQLINAMSETKRDVMFDMPKIKFE